MFVKSSFLKIRLKKKKKVNSIEANEYQNMFKILHALINKNINISSDSFKLIFFRIVFFVVKYNA